MAQEIKSTIGLAGAGLMGSALAERLIQAGFGVLAYDVDASKRAAIARLGAAISTSLTEMVERCDTIVLAVFNTDQVEQVVEGSGGVLETLVRYPGSRMLVCVSTCDPDRLAALAARANPHGAQILEAPISGTSHQVRAGDGVGLIGGDSAVMEKAAAVLDAICPRRFYLGSAGSGSRAKLAVNLILGLNRAAIAEGLVLAERLGLNPAAFLDVARGSAAYSQVMDVKGPLMAQRQFRNPQSRVDQSLKDFKLMLDQAHAAHQELPFASVYVGLLEDCMRNGEGTWDNSAILQAIERRRTV